MSNRRSLIGEVSLPKTSEKMWNRINVELFDNPSVALTTYNAQVDIDYVVSENTILSVYLSDGAYIYIKDSVGTTHLFNDTNIGSSQGVTVSSWTPLEDDNYKYIVFPMYLEVGDNGDKGKMLYEYLTVKYPNSYSNGLPEKIYVNGDIKPYLHSGYKLTDGGDLYVLHANGSITYEKYDTGGSIN